MAAKQPHPPPASPLRLERFSAHRVAGLREARSAGFGEDGEAGSVIGARRSPSVRGAHGHEIRCYDHSLDPSYYAGVGRSGMVSRFDDLIDQHANELKQTFGQKHRELARTTDLFGQTVESCGKKGWATHQQLWNIGLYVNVAAHDLSILVQQVALERDPWARRLSSRHVILVMYEVTEDMTQLLGRRLREALSRLGLLDGKDAALRNIRAPLDRFWSEHSRSLNEVRRAIAAHRDLDGLRLLQVGRRAGCRRGCYPGDATWRDPK